MQQLRGMPTEMLDKTCNLDRIEDQGVNMDDHMAVAASQSRGPGTFGPGASRLLRDKPRFSCQIPVWSATVQGNPAHQGAARPAGC